MMYLLTWVITYLMIGSVFLLIYSLIVMYDFRILRKFEDECIYLEDDKALEGIYKMRNDLNDSLKIKKFIISFILWPKSVMELIGGVIDGIKIARDMLRDDK